ncbi:MAG: ABC transporter substrate-binding protein [Pseudomonadota bacterium]
MNWVRVFALAIISALFFGAVSEGTANESGSSKAPARVVSMNLCTDQLAIMLSAPGQLLSVSYLARDETSSAMAKEAAAYPVNRGLAEEIFLLKPDLVIAGTFTTRATVGMLRRLGIPVVEFAPASSLDEIRERVAKMGTVLGREGEAESLLARFDADLDAARIETEERPRAATYYANSYTSGAGTLAHSVMEAAGLANIAIELGFNGGASLPLEQLVMERPDLIVTGRTFETPALAQEILIHPALQAIRSETLRAPVADRDWVCGTPFVIAAIKRLSAARAAVLAK